MRAQRRHREAPSWQQGAGTTGEQPARQHSCLPVHLLALPCRLEAGEGAGTAAAERETNRINPQENRVFLIALKLNTCTPWRAISSPIFHPSPRILHFTFPTRSAILGKLHGLNLSCSAKHNRLVEVTATTEMPAPPCHRQSCRNGSSDPHEQHALFQSKAIPSCPRTICPLAVNFIGAAQ